MNSYYITKSGDTTPQGPMTLEDIKAGMAQGTITPGHFYCVEGGTQWQPVSLLSAAPAAAMPPTAMKPDNQLIWSILVLLFCCLPTGIYSIIKSSQVDTLWMQGRCADAVASAAEAKKWNIIGAAIGGAGVLLYLVVIVIASVAGA